MKAGDRWHQLSNDLARSSIVRGARERGANRLTLGRSSSRTAGANSLGEAHKLRRMRVLLTSQPGYGHFRPLLPLAHALLAEGHEVRVATSASFAPVVEREGLPAEPAGLDFLHGDDSTIPAALRPPPEADTLATFFAYKFVRMTAGRLAADVVALASRWLPDVIVRETTEYGGLLAAQALGLPSAAVQVATPTLMSEAVLAEVAIALDELRRPFGLDPDPALAALRDEFVVCFAPPALHDPGVPLPNGLRSFHPGVPEPAEPLGELVDGLGVHRPLVYATLGTVFTDPEYQLPFFTAVRDGLVDVPVDLLMAIGPTGEPAAFGAQRPGALVVRYVAQRRVLDRSAVAVCHGGYGTLLDCIDAAVPLVVVPLGADQYLNAATVQRLGIGMIVEEESMSPQTVRDAVTLLLDDRAPQRSRLAALRHEWRALPGPDEAARGVVSLALAHRP